MRRKLSFGAVIFSIFLVPTFCSAAPSGIVKKGNQFYKKGDYTAALESYKKALSQQPDSDIINFNAGTAFYQQGDYAQAVEHLQKTLLTDDVLLQQQAAYNLGDAFYQQGKVREKQDVAFAIASWEKSLANFQKAMGLDKDDKDAQHNYEFVKKELERLKKQQQQQNKNCPLPKKQESSKDDQDKQRSQDQGQGQQQQGQQQEPQQQKNQEDAQEQNAQDDQENQQEGASKDSQSARSVTQGGSEDDPGHKAQGSSQEEKTPMDRKQAEAALADYQQNEEPQGLFYLLQKPSQDNAVEKDW